MGPVRRYWPIVALLGGGGLAYFEIRRAGGVTADNVFWLLVAGFIVVLALVDLIQGPASPEAESATPPSPSPPPPTNGGTDNLS